jgi:hypothetical protein
VILVVAALLALAGLAVKLFTYEFHLADDPTCGVALRLRPGWSNLARAASPARTRVLLEDENDFIGSGLYRGLVGWGFVVPLAGLALVSVAAWRARSGPR